MNIQNQSNRPQDEGGSTKLVLIAIGLAFLVTILNFIYLQSEKTASEEKTITVYRFKTPMRAGQRVDAEDLRSVVIPKRFRDAFSDALIDDPGDENVLATVSGRKVVRAVEQNAVLTHSVFTDEERNRLDQKITPGKRLIALPVNYKTLPAVLRPGMYVDIEAAFSVPGGGLATLPVMEYVRVLAVGKKSILDEQAETGNKVMNMGNYSTISIEVTPTEATHFSRISRITRGDFELHLRQPSDSERPKISDGGINPRVIELMGRHVETSVANTRNRR